MTISGGCFNVARKITGSSIWLKHPLYLKVWVWLLRKANYNDHEKDGFLYKRGEIVTTYHEIIQNAAYYHNRKHEIPTLKQIRIILEWLTKEGMILIAPIQVERPTGADPTARTRAYLGIKITIVNYNTYQDLENYKGRHEGRPFVQQGHNNNNEKECINKEGALSQLLEKYAGEERTLIEQTLSAIAQTRKSGRIKESVKYSILQQLERYPQQQVMAGCRTYHEKQYHQQGKNEKYLLGIIRNTPAQPEPAPHAFVSTGSKALDDYYRKQATQ